MKVVIKFIVKFSLYFVGFILLWFVAALLLSKIPVDSSPEVAQRTISIYVNSNGVHTDIIVPRTNNLYNWNSFVSDSLFNEIDSTYRYLSFGWGDKGFYLETPTWNDLKVSTALNAAFGLGKTAMHVTYYKKMRCDENTKLIKLSEEDYLKLVNTLKQSFNTSKSNCLQLISHPNYGRNDNYFEANGSYSLFKTCNVWTGNTLKCANVKMGLWTPLSSGVIENIE